MMEKLEVFDATDAWIEGTSPCNLTIHLRGNIYPVLHISIFDIDAVSVYEDRRGILLSITKTDGLIFRYLFPRKKKSIYEIAKEINNFIKIGGENKL